jgi:SulP family sulfate permease
VINCSSISNIDASALETLEEINNELKNLKIQMHFTEIKGPVMDRLKQSNLINELSGTVYLTHYQAMHALDAQTFR